MNPLLLYIIKDNHGKTIFEFLPGSLLDKITDVWPVIMEYYKNYYPFAIDTNREHYRPLTYEEFKTDNFIKLFATSYRKKKIIFPLSCCNYIISIEKYNLHIKVDDEDEVIYIPRYDHMLAYYDEDSDYYMDIINNIERIYVNESNHDWAQKVSILVLSHIVF